MPLEHPEAKVAATRAHAPQRPREEDRQTLLVQARGRGSIDGWPTRESERLSAARRASALGHPIFAR